MTGRDPPLAVRRRAAPLLSALVAIALAAIAPACKRTAPDATPEGAVRQWLEKMEASTSDPSQTREAYALLGPAARANLAERAELASKVQGRRVEPYEMLTEGRFGLRFRPKAMVTHVDPSGTSATVEVTGDEPLTEHARVRCARDPSTPEPAWRVEPDLPPMVALPKRADAPPP